MAEQKLEVQRTYFMDYEDTGYYVCVEDEKLSKKRLKALKFLKIDELPGGKRPFWYLYASD